MDPFFNAGLQFAGVEPQSDLINKDSTFNHPVGSCYGGGVVFYVTKTASSEQHGLIAALDDDTSNCTGENNTCYWDKNAVVTTVVTSTSFFSGLENTNKLVKLGNTGTEAANAASNHTAELGDCLTCTNWYLPAQDELITLSAQVGVNPATFWTKCLGTPLVGNGSGYWSSSQLIGTPTGVWSLLTVGVGYVGVNPTASTLRVRAIRAF